MKKQPFYIPSNPLTLFCWSFLYFSVFLIEPVIAACWLVAAVAGIIVSLQGADVPAGYQKAEQVGVDSFTDLQNLLFKFIDAYPTCGFILFIFWYLAIGTLILYPAVALVMLVVRLVRGDRSKLKEHLRLLLSRVGNRKVIFKSVSETTLAVFIVVVFVSCFTFCVASLIGLIAFGGNLLIYDKGLLESLLHAKSIARYVFVSVSSGLHDFLVYLPGFLWRNPIPGAVTALVLFVRVTAFIVWNQPLVDQR